MDKKLIEKINTDPSNTDIERFDDVVGGLLTKEVSKSFTRNVIARIQPSVQKVDCRLKTYKFHYITFVLANYYKITFHSPKTPFSL